jgi:hypothetical protein
MSAMPLPYLASPFIYFYKIHFNCGVMIVPPFENKTLWSFHFDNWAFCF